MPDLHNSFSANQNLIIDFLQINSYMPQVIAAFNDSWERTTKTSLLTFLRRFALPTTPLMAVVIH
jgi:hypothetical protein